MLLKVGSKGDDVKKLQTKLGTTADGIFGPGTEKLVKDFQAANGLTADGIVGDGTWSKMFGSVIKEDVVIPTGGPLKLEKLKGHIPDSVISQIPNTADKFGITNTLRLSHFLAQCGHESGGFKPKSENLNYSAERIREVWPSTSVADSKKYANNPESFGNWKYGRTGGNSSTEGYKYRGRGYNQITFKDSYKKYGDAIGVNLVADPDKLNNPKYAGLAAIAYFKLGLKGLDDAKSAYYGNSSKNINTFTTLEDAVGAIYHANAGIGKTIAAVIADTTGGRKKAFNVSGYMLEISKAGKIT